MTRAVARDRLGSRIDALVTAKNKNFINVMIAVWFNTLIKIENNVLSDIQIYSRN